MSPLEVTVDLSGPFATLQRGLQHTVERVAIGLNATLNEPEAQSLFPQVFVQLMPSSEPAMTFEEAKTDFPSWILACGFRDAVEDVSSYLEDSRSVLAALAFGPKPNIPEAQFRDAISREGTQGDAFRKANFPAKISMLQKSFDLAVDLAPEVLSINRARACLVHRAGFVAAADCDSDDVLRLLWRAPVLLRRDSKGEHPLIPNEVVEEESQIVLRVDAKSRTLKIGDLVRMDAQEFMEVCFTIMTFADGLRMNVEQYAKAIGHPTAGEGGS